MTTQLLQQAIYLNQAGPSNATTYFYDLPTTFKRRNPYIFPSTSSNPLKIVDLVDVFSVIDRDLAQSPFIEGSTLLSCFSFETSTTFQTDHPSLFNSLPRGGCKRSFRYHHYLPRHRSRFR
jgi:hypothetical protein